MGIPLLQIDAFTATPFRGNPAAVCLLPAAAAETWMQAVAAEMNLAETAFLHPAEDGYRLRWFTPLAEVALCGHATLASAHALWETGRLAPTAPARFHTASGLLTAQRLGTDIELTFPATPATPATPPPGLTLALGVEPSYVGQSSFDYLVVLDDEATLRAMTPDFARLRAVTQRGVMVTSRSAAAEYDFVSRFFAPAVGIDEDPVTGSAHCCLGPYWQGVLGKSDFVAYQASARGGEVGVRVAGDRVYLRGQAVTVLRGELVAG